MIKTGLWGHTVTVRVTPPGLAHYCQLSEMLELLERVEALPGLHTRAVASLLGAAVADGAARPLHWVYNKTELENILQVQREGETDTDR